MLGRFTDVLDKLVVYPRQMEANLWRTGGMVFAEDVMMALTETGMARPEAYELLEGLARQIRNVIEPVTIRRNRLDLQNNPFYKNEVKELPKVADPMEWFFELSKEQSEFYTEIIEN